MVMRRRPKQQRLEAIRAVTFRTRSLLTLLVTLGTVLLPISATRAASYYVSPTGSDANPGTRSRPWRTLLRVNSNKFSAGDRILLEGGETFEGNLILDDRSTASPRRPVIIGSYGQGRARIHAGKGTGLLIRNLGGVVIRDLVLKGENAGTNRGFGVAVVNERGTAQLESVWIDHVEASGFHWAGIYVGGAPDLPGIKTPESGRYGFRNVRISRCAVHGNMYYGIWVSGPWVRVHKEYAKRGGDDQ